MEKVLEIKKADIFVEKDKKVLEHVDFSINKGEFVYLIGRTGSGKSSLLKTLYADLSFYSGRIMVAGFNLNDITHSQVPFLRRKIGIIFSGFPTFFRPICRRKSYFCNAGHRLE